MNTKLAYDPLPEYRSKTRTGFVQKKLSGVLGEGSLRIPRTATKERVVSSTANRFSKGDLSHKLPDQKMFSKGANMNEFQEQIFDEAFEDELQKIAETVTIKVPFAIKSLLKGVEGTKGMAEEIPNILKSRKYQKLTKKTSLFKHPIKKLKYYKKSKTGLYDDADNYYSPEELFAHQFRKATPVVLTAGGAAGGAGIGALVASAMKGKKKK